VRLGASHEGGPDDLTGVDAGNYTPSVSFRRAMNIR